MQGGLQETEMDSADLWKLALLLVCLLLSAFFSSSETAFIAFPRTRLIHLVNIGHTKAMRVSQMIQRPERLLATVLLSNNLVNTAAAALGTAIAINVIDNPTIAVIVSTFGVTALLLVFSETLPKTVAWNRSEQVAFAVSKPLQLVEWILSPAIHVLQGITKLFTKVFGITPSDTNVGEQEIRTLIAVGAETGEVEASEAALLERVFRFGDQQIREVMTPRPEIVWIEMGTKVSQFLTIYEEHSHSRFPVFEGAMENVTGILSVKDVLLAMSKSQLESEASVTQFQRPAYFAPETKPVSDTFTEMQQGGHGLVLAVDEFGGIAGIATLKRLLEVIVGDVGDDDAAPADTYIAVDENTYRLGARMGIAEINDELGLQLPLGDYQTIAGFILDKMGNIPREGDTVDFEDLKFTVTSMEGVRIEQIEVLKRETATPPPSEEKPKSGNGNGTT